MTTSISFEGSGAAFQLPDDRTKYGRIGLGDWVLVRAKCAAILDDGIIAVQTQSSKGPDTAWHYVKDDHVLTIAEARKSFEAKP